MQGTWVWPLVWEDSTRHATTTEAQVTQLLSLYATATEVWSLCSTRDASAMRRPHTTQWLHNSLQLETAHMQQWRPTAAKN